MGLTRYYGKTEKLPNHYVELVMNDKKEIAFKIVYREDYSVIPWYKLSEDIQELLEPMTKTDFSLLKGEEFKVFINEREKLRKIHAHLLNKEEAFKIEGGKVIYADELMDGRLYVTYYFEDVFGYGICHFSEKNQSFIEHHFFTEEELNCPSNLYYLKNSIPKDKVAIFDTPLKGITYGLYKSKDYFVIGEIEGNILTDNIKVYNNDYLNVTENKDTDIEMIKEKVNLYCYKLHIIHLASSFIPSM